MLGNLVLFLTLGQCISTPTAIEDYFDEEVKVVSIPTRIAIEACVTPHEDLLDKIDTSTSGCLGNDDDFDWKDFNNLNTGPGTGDNGLSIKLENAEVCFYKAMGWVVGGQIKQQSVKDDFSGLDPKLKTTFKNNIGECATWNGNFGSGRRKREAVFYENIGGEEDLGEDTYPEVLPEEAEERGGLMSWIWDLAKSRSRREIKKAPAKKFAAKKPVLGGGFKGVQGKQGQGQVKQGALKKGQGQGKQGTFKKGQGQFKQSAFKKGQGQIMPKGKQKKKIPTKKKAIKVPKTPNGNSNVGAPKDGGPQREVSDAVYNKLWCFDLAIEQALKKCVMDKILDL